MEMEYGEMGDRMGRRKCMGGGVLNSRKWVKKGKDEYKKRFWQRMNKIWWPTGNRKWKRGKTKVTTISSSVDWGDDGTIKNENTGVHLTGRTNAFHLKPIGQSGRGGASYFLGTANCFPLPRLQGETSHFPRQPALFCSKFQGHTILYRTQGGRIPFTLIPNLSHLMQLPPKVYSKQ